MSNKNDELRPEYSAELIRSGVRGKYANQYEKGNNLVLIEPDLRKLFPDAKAVNDALRKYASEHQLARS